MCGGDACTVAARHTEEVWRARTCAPTYTDAVHRLGKRIGITRALPQMHGCHHYASKCPYMFIVCVFAGMHWGTHHLHTSDVPHEPLSCSIVLVVQRYGWLLTCQPD